MKATCCSQRIERFRPRSVSVMRQFIFRKHVCCRVPFQSSNIYRIAVIVTMDGGRRSITWSRRDVLAKSSSLYMEICLRSHLNEMFWLLWISPGSDFFGAFLSARKQAKMLRTQRAMERVSLILTYPNNATLVIWLICVERKPNCSSTCTLYFFSCLSKKKQTRRVANRHR